MAKHKQKDNEPQTADTDRVETQPTADAASATEAASNYSVQDEIARSMDNARRSDAATANGDKKPREAKDVRFRRIAQKRVSKALNILANIHNLTNTAQYSYTPDQAQRIVDVLVDAVNRIADGFSGKRGGKQTFIL